MKTLKQQPSGVEYHRVLAGEDRRIGRGILAIVLLVGGLFAAIAALSYLGQWLDEMLFPDGWGEAVEAYSPVTFAAALIATALLIPWSMVIQRWLYGVPAASLHSVASHFRFTLFGRALLVIVPAFVVALATTELLAPGGTAMWSQRDTVLMLVVMVLLVPLQSAGEEYGLRGLVFRVAGSWARGRWISLLLGVLVSSAVFAVIHTAADPWWNVFYVVFSLTTSFVTWRTGGVEVAVVMHAAYNTLTFVFWIALSADLAERFDRSAGAVTAALMAPTSLVLIAIAVVVGLRTRRTGPVRTP
ncbi:CPBP family intramembrane metalloprotease [Ruania suaedae]|uniref:CPBP family intramembrane glutamic endopeptidase n=1 Tax=Ruania suaedae TaxID=2897774 RepID=UPI001E4A18E1|nr:CPBP family intramembrane glutamic endopeptidase [Ruania suaedae]UFU03721.1 CPBP family intramembrane metalloprotease [Ruania suaedae]